MATRLKSSMNMGDMVALYYLGGLDRRNPGKGRVTSGERAFALPKPGEPLHIERIYAEDLMRKHKYLTENGETVSVFTLNARVAERVRRGMNPIQAQQALIDHMSDEQILAIARERGLMNDAVVEEDPEPEPTAAPTPPVQNRSGKAVKPAAKSPAKTKAKPKEPVAPTLPTEDTVDDLLDNGLTLE